MTNTDEPLKAPFPYPGGKAKVADAVWKRLGNVDNYVEPFAGSLAVLLRRPADHFAGTYRVETVNDANHFLVNFWRAVKHSPAEVAEWSDWPVTEADLHARHRWLMQSDYAGQWRLKMNEEPDHYDAKIAGWWVWGMCCWIGTGWCVEGSPASLQMPDFDAGRGVLAAAGGRPQLCDAFDIGRGVNGGASVGRQIPLISGPGDGVDAVAGLHAKRPNFPDARSPGIGLLALHSPESAGQVRDLSGGFGGGMGIHGAKYLGTCSARREWLTDWMQRLADRLRLVRTCYGHWDRICDSDSTLSRLGVTGAFLDPPYPLKSTSGKKSRADGLYANDRAQDLNKLRDGVLAWCRKWGDDKSMRIAVCGYEGDGYEPLTNEGWREESWEASGGYGNQKKGKGKAENAKRERIWYSPHCVAPQRGLFDDLEVAA